MYDTRDVRFSFPRLWDPGEEGGECMVMIRVAAESLSVPIGTNMSRVIHVTERRIPFESINQLRAGRSAVLKIDATSGSGIG